MRVNRLGASAVRVASVTAVAATVVAMAAGVASAATSHAKKATTTSVSVSPKTAFVREVVKLSATVKGATPRGTVTFKIDGTKICAVKVAHTKASCRIEVLRAGTFNVRAFYSGNATHKASSSGIAKLKEVRAATTTKITNANPGTVVTGHTFTFHVTVATQAGAPAANGSVKVAPFAPAGLGAAFDCTAKVTNGKGSCSITASEYGIDDYAATFVANAADKTSASSKTNPYDLAIMNTSTTTVVVNSDTTGAISLTADVDALGNNIDMNNGGTGSVTFYVGTNAGNLAAIPECAGMLLTGFTAPNNTVTCDGSATLNALKKGGSYLVSAVFSGDDVNQGSTSANVGLDPS
jgi:hypothetical protein